jgi:hypothetical protein
MRRDRAHTAAAKPGEEQMFVVIRKYRITGSFDELTRRVEQGLVPILKAAPGFRSYYTFDCGNGTGASISIFETEKAAVTSNEQAVDWVRKNLTEFLPEPPEILVGETGVAVSV